MMIQILDTELQKLIMEAAEQSAHAAAEQTAKAIMEKYTLTPKSEEVHFEKETQTKSIGNVSEKDIKNMMEVMRANLNTQDHPKVGIFWYQMVGKRLFGVIAVDKDSIKSSNVGGGLITCYELHRNVWKKKFREFGYSLNDYKDHARGRVFFNPSEEKYIITVGSWIDECPEAEELIVEEFNLQNQNYVIEKSIHWEIGNGWENS